MIDGGTLMAVRPRSVRHEEIWTGEGGGRLRATPARREAVQTAAEGRNQSDLHDRGGPGDPRLRWGSETNGWWYMISGPKYWVRQGKAPAFHHGHYYIPGRWYPVTPPRDTWPKRDSYHGIAGQSGLIHLVPQDVAQAARSERPGRERPYDRATDGPTERERRFRQRTDADTTTRTAPPRPNVEPEKFRTVTLPNGRRAQVAIYGAGRKRIVAIKPVRTSKRG